LGDGAPSAVTADDDSASLIARIDPLASTDATVRTALGQVRANLSDDEAWGDLGDALGSGHRELANGCYRRAMRLDKTDKEWQRKIREMGGNAQLLALFEELLRASPTNDELYGDYGDALAEAGNRSEACRAYQAAARFDADDTEWATRVSECEGGTSSAPTTSVGSSPGIDAALAALRDAPGDATLTGEVGNAYARAGDGRQALEYYRRALDLNPLDVTWVDKIVLYGGTNRISVFESLNVGTTSSDEFQGDFGDAYLDAGRAADARARYERAHELDPNDSEWIGKLAVLLGGDPRAESIVVAPLRRGVARDASNDEIHGDMGDALMSLGRRDEACTAYRQALALDADDSEWPGKVERCSKSLGELLSALQDSSDNDEIAGAIGFVHLARGDRSAALGSFRQALSLDPMDSRWWNFVLAYGGQSRVEVLEDIAVSSTSDEVWGDLGDAYARDGRVLDARLAYRRAHDLDNADSEWTGKLEGLPGSDE
ncbi:MAG: tetratricopeptide repeat protein, partial [Deltaproteobacteria bacterium]|nr:tetratricopeptide repeat protein [Deltaproteobacteria bacterium]